MILLLFVVNKPFTKPIHLTIYQCYDHLALLWFQHVVPVAWPLILKQPITGKDHLAEIASVRSGLKQIWLVVSTPLTDMKVSWDYYSQYMGK